MLPIVQSVLQVTQIITGLMLIGLVIIHSPKGDGIGGFGSAAQMFSTPQGAEAGLTKITTWVAIIFFTASFILGYYFAQPIQ